MLNLLSPMTSTLLDARRYCPSSRTRVVLHEKLSAAAVARVAIKEKNEDFAIIFYKNSNPF